MKQDELNKILELHKLWLQGDSKGERANLSEADLIEANLYGADLIEANLYGADLRRADLSGANLSEANLTGVDLKRADLRRVNLIEANLKRADLIGANLEGADLRQADLWRADLREADLRGADLREADLMTFQFNQYTAYYTYTGYLKIGCLDHTLDYWLENYQEIGKKHNFSKLEIKQYFNFIKQCKEVYDATR